MALEVEIKFRLTDRRQTQEKLALLGARFIGEERHRDCYYAPPHRDFAQTDEALRIRRTDALGWITYKGPKIDAVTKTRSEIEAALDPNAADRLEEILESLSFRPVLEVVKKRSVFTLPYRGFAVSALLDEVERLHAPFIELEIHATEGEFGEAREAVLALAHELGLSDSERRSYLEMLLAEGAQ